MELKTKNPNVSVIRDIDDARTFFEGSLKEKTIYLQLENVLRRNNIDLMFSTIKEGKRKAEDAIYPQVVRDFLKAAHERLLQLGIGEPREILGEGWFFDFNK